MLEVKNLVKIYKPRQGVPVTALNDVSLKFPETGMVFLLGKSGSGKSTLLNVLGGLDRVNRGQIIVGGKSTGTFRQSHFDSYRNTYVGFIFQEYNILDEFSVGTNIALALQLQGRHADTNTINGILRQVDLDGYGTRKPNELSGGQKQRVAIARALVKDPRIIMADEPTGALDSDTGRQVLTTLKKLSADRLVIVVSHDREFAEQYADRIVELADGRVIRDVERVTDRPLPELQAPQCQGDTIFIPEDYEFTEADRQAVLEYIQTNIRQGKQLQVKGSAAREQGGFLPTDESRIPASQDGYKLIRSRLPMEFAFKMGASGLKYKKFRLFMTIFLSFIAFTLFGLADTAASYDYVTTCVNSLNRADTQICYATLEKEQLTGNTYWSFSPLTQEDRQIIADATGLEFYNIYDPSNNWSSNYRNADFEENTNIWISYGSYYATELSGFIEVDAQVLADLGGELVAGSLPTSPNEIAISTFILETFQEFGYRTTRYTDEDTQSIQGAEDMIGKTLTLLDYDFTVCGVVDPGMDFERFESLQDSAYDSDNLLDYLAHYALSRELQYTLSYSLAGLGMVAPGELDTIAAYVSESSDFYFCDIACSDNFYWSSVEVGLSAADGYTLQWLDGTERQSLNSTEIVISESMAQYLLPDETVTEAQLTMNNGDCYTVQIVGLIKNDEYQRVLVNEALLPSTESVESQILQIVAGMPESRSDIQDLVELSAREITLSDGSVVRYNLMNPVSYELKNLDEVFLVLRTVFMWIGLVFVAFASLLLANFIGISISHKKVQIGILRAIGSRSADVFRIFFSESFIIAMINFALSLAATVGLSSLFNRYIQASTGMLLTVMNVGIRQVVLLFGICVLVAAAASYLPVNKIASKRPIDAIRDR